MNIAFLVSANKTIIFEKVARLLKNDGYSSFWITPSRRWNDWLILNGVASENILDLTKSVSGIDNSDLTEDEVDSISLIEKSTGVAFNDLLLMDRVLREKGSNFSLRYMLTCFTEISNFLVRNRVQNVFSEQTWNFEIITTVACNILKINSYYPDGVKVPDGEDIGRFAFFNGYLRRELPKGVSYNSHAGKVVVKFLDDYRNAKSGTTYLKSYAYKPSFKLNWFHKIYNHVYYYIVDSFDYTRRPLFSLIKYRLLQLVNFYKIKYFFSFEDKKFISDKYVLIALHKQPDSAVDVAAASYLNQIEAIITFCRKVPIEYDIVIKDHAHALGLNSLSVYRELNKIKNVRIVNPSENLLGLIDKAELVFSIAGTASLEAAVMGKRSITAVKTFFSPVLMRETFDPYTITTQDIRNIMEDAPPSNSLLIEYLKVVFNKCPTGMVLDPKKDPIYGSEKNINSIYKGFYTLLSASK